MGVLTDDVPQHRPSPTGGVESTNNELCQSNGGTSANLDSITGKYYDVKTDYANAENIMNYIGNGNDGTQYIVSPPTGNSDDTNFVRSRGCKKEKKRTECINSAFSDLRRRIPNVPLDTKLSKIKTLRLATSYIQYLTDIVRNSDPEDVRDGREFRADLKALRSRERRRELHRKQTSVATRPEDPGHERNNSYPSNRNLCDDISLRKKGRTGWPEAVWAMELENIPPSLIEHNMPPAHPDIITSTTHQAQPQLHKCYTNYPTQHFDGEVSPTSRQDLSHNPAISNHYGNTLIGYSIIPTIRENQGYVSESYATYDDFVPYLPYAPLPLPGASSFSRRYSQFLPPNDSEQQDYQIANLQSLPTIESAGATAYEPGCYQNNIEDAGGNMQSSVVAEITLIPDGNYRWGQAENEVGGVQDSKPIQSKFAELKTVSAASIRISTSTVNGSGIFTAPGNAELQCFGATRVVESGCTA